MLRNGVTVAVCGIKCIDLTKECFKILGTYYSYNQNLQIEKTSLKTIKNKEKVLKIWRTRNLTLEEKITVFKLLVLSKNNLFSTGFASFKNCY